MSNGLAFAQIRSRPSAFVGTFIALLFGAVVIISSGTLLLAAATASPQPVRYRPAPVVVAADQFVGGQQIPDRVRLGTGLADRLAALPGVSEAVADTVFPATATAPGRTAVTLDGQPASSARILATGDGAAGKVTPRAGQTVLDTRTAKALGVSRGDTVTLTSPAGTGSFEVSRRAHRPDSRRLVRERRGRAAVRPPGEGGRDRGAPRGGGVHRAARRAGARGRGFRQGVHGRRARRGGEPGLRSGPGEHRRHVRCHGRTEHLRLDLRGGQHHVAVDLAAPHGRPHCCAASGPGRATSGGWPPPRPRWWPCWRWR